MIIHPCHFCCSFKSVIPSFCLFVFSQGTNTQLHINIHPCVLLQSLNTTSVCLCFRFPDIFPASSLSHYGSKVQTVQLQWAYLQPIKIKAKFDFKVSGAFSLFSESDTLLSRLTAWLAGWLKRGPRRDNRRKENSNIHTHTHIRNNTHTLPSFKQLQMALILCPLSFTIYQVTHSERACLLFMPRCDDLTLLQFIRRRRRRRGRKSLTALINVEPLTSVAAETISLHHQFKLPSKETLEGAPIQNLFTLYTLTP